MRRLRTNSSVISVAEPAEPPTRSVYLRAPTAADEDEFTSLMRISRAFHRPWASAPADHERYVAYLNDAARDDFEAFLVCRAEDDVIVGFFGELGLHRVEANIQPGNAPSIALAEGAGFKREGFSPRYLKIGGRWRDHERYAILAEDWLTSVGER